MGMIRYISLLLFIGLAWGQSEEIIINLLNGELIKGDVIEVVPNQYIVVRTEGGEQKRISYAHIDYILHNAGLANVIQAAAEEAKKKMATAIFSNPDIGFLTVHAYNDNVKLKISGVNDVQSLPREYFELEHGTYILKAFGEGLESEKVTVDVERQKTTKVEINLNPKQRAKAVWYSMMFPGGGQFYEGSKSRVRGLIYAGTFIGTGALLSKGISTYSNENKLLDQYQANYQAATSAADIDATWALYEQQSATVNDAQTNLMILSTTLVSAWLTSVIDSYFFSGL